MITIHELQRAIAYLDPGELFVALQSHYGALYALTDRGRLLRIDTDRPY